MCAHVTYQWHHLLRLHIVLVIPFSSVEGELRLFHVVCCITINLSNPMVSIFTARLNTKNSVFCPHSVIIQGVTGGTDQTSGECSLC